MTTSLWTPRTPARLVRALTTTACCAALVACGPSPAGGPDPVTPGGGTNGGGATAGGTNESGGTEGGSAPAVPTGPKAPDFSLPTLDGDQISLSDYQGKKVVLLDFWATHCDPCLREMPELVKIYNERKDQGFIVLAVATDGPDTASAIPAKVKSTGMNFPVLLDEDSEVVDRYNPKGEMPFTLVIDRSGSIVLKRAGYQPGDEASTKKLIDAIDAALARK